MAYATLPSGSVAIDTADSGDTTLKAAVSGKVIRVTAYTLIAQGDVDVTFKSGSTEITGPMTCANDGSGLTPGYNPQGHFQTAKGEALVINLSGAVQVGGHLTWELDG